jgi:hypothetical protein
MFDPFGRDKNDNEGDGGGPRIIFANLRPSGRPILTEAGYRIFSASAFFGWALVVFIVWVFRIEVTLTQELVTSLAGASVELSALSLAVLGILHELNKKDRWFKLGLFLVSILFAGVVCGGFFLALTWQPTFALPQLVTVKVVGVLALVTIIQIDWGAALPLSAALWFSTNALLSKVSAATRRIRLGVPFVTPIFLIWLPGLNRLTALVVLFAGSLIALVVLMAVTTFSLFKSRDEGESDDPFIGTLRRRYENEIKSLIRFGELKTRAIDALRDLQADKVKAIEASTGEQSPRMVDMPYLTERLRQMGITEDKHVLESVVRSLVEDGSFCREDYSGPYWTVPGEEAISQSQSRLAELGFVVSENPTYKNSKSIFTVEGYRLTNLRDSMALKIQLPTFVVGEYVIPRLLKQLLNEEDFRLFKAERTHIFINRESEVSHDEWEKLVEEAQEAAKEDCERQRRSSFYRMGSSEERKCLDKYTWYNILKRFPHTDDVDDVAINRSDIMTIGSFLTRH